MEYERGGCASRQTYGVNKAYHTQDLAAQLKVYSLFEVCGDAPIGELSSHSRCTFCWHLIVTCVFDAQERGLTTLYHLNGTNRDSGRFVF